MRTLIKGYTFTAGTRSIDCSNSNTFDIENIRLIVNETQKVVICSSMQKDLIVSIIDGVITYTDTLPTLAEDDKLTIELDLGVSGAEALEAEVYDGKTNIANSISDKGIPATSADTFSILANKITQIENTYDSSMADAGLAQHLAYWTGNNCDRIFTLMWRSGLVREKWQREDYLQRTILRAVALQDKFYQAVDTSVVDKFGAGKITASTIP